MRKAQLRRNLSNQDGTTGDYKSDSGLELISLERSVFQNRPNLDAIPEGKYVALWQWSKKHSCNLYHLQDVPGRDNIEIHSANIYQQILGCISLGHAEILFKRNSIRPGCPDRDMWGVTESVKALAEFEKDMRDKDGKQESFELEIL